MDSSDESFAWTDASSDSSTNTEDMKPNSNGGAERDEDILLTEPNSDQHKQKQNKKKHKKHALDNKSMDSEISEPVKSEPMSDLDVARTIKKDEYDQDLTDSTNLSLNKPENYLDLRVKQEQTAVELTPIKKKKKKKAKESEEQDMLSKDEVDIEEHNFDSMCLVNGNHSEARKIDVSSKNKKKKKRQKSMEYDTCELIKNPEDYHESKKKKKNKELLQNIASDFQLENGEIASSTLIQNSMRENVKEYNNSDLQNDSTFGMTDKSTNHRSNSFKETSRISDRLKFEDDSIGCESAVDDPANDVSIQLEQFINCNSNLRPLQKKLHKGPEINDDDDVWILKGPHDISVTDFENVVLPFDGKKKVKINKNTYDTTIDTSISTASVLHFNKTKLLLKNMPLKGVINLCKKIPRIRIPYDSLIMNNSEYSFIPLPETKCRHPFFGIHYKKAAKVSPRVADRLQLKTVQPDASCNKNRKKGKLVTEPDNDLKLSKEELRQNKNQRKMQQKLKLESDDDVKPSLEILHSKTKKKKIKDRLKMESDSEIKTNIELFQLKKKKKKSKEQLRSKLDVDVKSSDETFKSNKKKRKHSDEKASRKKDKRFKYDPSSPHAWESEQAIENSLFNF